MRWILRIALTLLALVVLAVAALFLIPTDKIASIAEAKFEENTGRKLTLTGEVRPQLFPRLGVSLGEVKIANADWAGAEPMVEAARLEIGVGFSALFSGDIVVETFTIESPVIRLRRNAQGAENWEFLTSDAPESEGGGLTDFSLPKGVISNATLSYVDDQSGQAYSLTEMDAELFLADLRGLAQVNLSARLQGEVVKVDATLNGVQQLLDGGIQSVDVEAAIAGNTVEFQGSAGIEPLQAKGNIFADIANLKGMMAIAGQAMPVIPVGMGQHPKLRGGITLAPDGGMFLRNAEIDLDHNRLTGDVDVTPGDVPFVKARLSGGALDFSAMSTDNSSGDGAANAGAGGWSDARLDVSGLGAVNGEFTFQALSVDLGSIQLGATALKGSLDRSRLVLDLGGVRAFDGQVSGQFVVNNRNGLSVGGDLQAAGIAMQKVLDDFAGFDRLVGAASMQLKFLGVGQTMNQIMNGLSGSGRLDVGAGELLGLDVAGMLRNLDLSYVGDGSKTVFDDITASFAIQDGILRNDDLNFASNLLTATGRGALDLGGQTIDYRVEPVALAAQLDRGISVPFLIEGPWSNVRFRPDLKGLIDQNLEAEKAKLKAKAKAEEDRAKRRLEAKLKEKLGVERQSGQSTEEAIKDSLEQKAKDKLRRLLGGN
jgi:AsmA protein